MFHKNAEAPGVTGATARQKQTERRLYFTSEAPRRQLSNSRHCKIAKIAERLAFWHLARCQPGQPEFGQHYRSFCQLLDLESFFKARTAK